MQFDFLRLKVLQCSVDRELNLYSTMKDQTNVVGKVTMLSVSSQPVDHDDNGRRKIRGVGAGEWPGCSLIAIHSIQLPHQYTFERPAHRLLSPKTHARTTVMVD